MFHYSPEDRLYWFVGCSDRKDLPVEKSILNDDFSRQTRRTLVDWAVPDGDRPAVKPDGGRIRLRLKVRQSVSQPAWWL